MKTLICMFLSFSAYAQIPAFPGAEGFGRYASGGRAGDVYIVTNLNDSGSGSFRDAVSQPNRIVVFEVGGIIHIGSRVVVSPNITIAGQTAPGDGIVIYGNGVSYSAASNSICRYLRVRMGVGGDSGKDALGIANGANMIFDHVSVSWGRDENFSISWDNKGLEPANITIQHSIMGQGLWSHSCGGLIQTNGGVSLYCNLYIDNKTRNPKVKGKNEFVNNVIYNWGNGGAYILGDSQGTSEANIINNYFIAGPAVNDNTAPFTRGNINFGAFASGNYYDSSRDGSLNGTLLVQDDYGTGDRAINWQSTPYAYPLIPDSGNVLTTDLAYQTVLQQVGASYPHRDEVDQFMINELSSLGTEGVTINTFTNENLLPTGGPGNVSGGVAPTDTDRDGMPDQWELANGLNPANAADGKILNTDGYTNLEHYINGIMDSVTMAAKVNAKPMLRVTPNPIANQGIIQYMFPQKGNYVLEILNMKGEVMRNIANSNTSANTLLTHTLDVTNLSNGIYIVRLVTAYKTVSVKMVVLH